MRGAPPGALKPRAPLAGSAERAEAGNAERARAGK